MRFTSQHKVINPKEYGKAVSPLRYDSLALILYRFTSLVYGKQSEKISNFAMQRGILPYTLFGILPSDLWPESPKLLEGRRRISGLLQIITYLRRMNGYIYNVTIGADRSCAPDVMYYIEHKLFPAWADREGWQNAKLLSIPTHREDGISVALQFEIKHPDLLKGYALEEDPLVARIAQAYSDKVTFYPTLMEIIK